MRCETCAFLLDDEDNYCRKCGAPILIARLPVVRKAQPPALFRSTATPLAGGAAAVAAAALLRWVAGQAIRSLIAAADQPRRVEPPRRSLTRREAEPPPRSAANEPHQLVEIFWYRRVMRDPRR